MEKIKALLEKAGCKPELTDKICESLESYKETLREQFDNEYAAKVQEVRKVCVEETESHKRELARRVQIFCETKGAAIESTLAKQSALNESEALTKLKNVQSLLSDIQPNGVQNGDVKLKKAQQQVKIANEARQKAETIANRQTAIAEKALKAQRQLTAKVRKLEESQGPKAPAVNESRGKGRPGRRIDEGRSARGRGRSTRPTILENQSRKAPQGQRNVGGGSQIDEIAADMDSDL